MFVPHPKKNRYEPKLTLGPRPKHKDITNGRINAKAILNVMNPNEFTPEMEQLAVKAGYHWGNMPSDARPWANTQSSVKHWIEVGTQIEYLLDYFDSVYVHCAAGIHRTGIAAYTWYRDWNGGCSHKEAFYYIVKHRPVIETDIGNKILPMRHYFDGKVG